MERSADLDLKHRLPPLAALGGLALMQLAACAEREVWTGRRCPGTQLECALDGKPSDAAGPPVAAGDADAELSLPVPVDAGNFEGNLDACLDCGPAQLPASKCVPGHYSGQAHARYVPTAAGVCGLVTLFGGEGSATLDFDLEAMGGAMFSMVGETCLDLAIVPDAGADDEFLMTVERKMGMRGLLDCNTGEFQGEVRGIYSTVSLCDLGTSRQDYFFKGPMTARYDPATRSFVSGRIVMREPPVPLALGGEAGGEGTWNARLNPEASKSPEPRDCLGGTRFPDELFPSAGDAGM